VVLSQADAYRGADRLGQFQLLADWRLQDMQQWVLVSHQKEGDTAALKRYRKQVRSPASVVSVTRKQGNRAALYTASGHHLGHDKPVMLTS
jgi:hypothetical protein